MSAMAERVARKLAGFSYGGEGIAPDKFIDEHWLEYIVAARIAIAAMREPTGAMIVEGQKAMAGAITSSHREATSLPLLYKLAAVEPRHTRAEYQAMIDEALK